MARVSLHFLITGKATEQEVSMIEEWQKSLKLPKGVALGSSRKWYEMVHAIADDFDIKLSDLTNTISKIFSGSYRNNDS